MALKFTIASLACDINFPLGKFGLWTFLLLSCLALISPTHANPTDFISTWRTTANDESITLPLKDGGNYNFTIDWGDGSPLDAVTAWDDADNTHTYATSGDYQVTISGTLEGWIFNDAGDKEKIIQISFKSLSGATFNSAMMAMVVVVSFSAALI